jgi:hypothetical protein
VPYRVKFLGLLEFGSPPRPSPRRIPTSISRAPAGSFVQSRPKLSLRAQMPGPVIRMAPKLTVRSPSRRVPSIASLPETVPECEAVIAVHSLGIRASTSRAFARYWRLDHCYRMPITPMVISAGR